MKSRVIKTVMALSLSVGIDAGANSVYAGNSQSERIKEIVDAQIMPEMKKLTIPGMAVAIVKDGQQYILNYGVASKSSHKPVTDSTLFEIGSISKTFTATLASYAQIEGKLALSDKTSKFIPNCINSPFGNLKLLNLGTHTPGGLPLQLPPNVTNYNQLQQFLKQWKPSCESGKFRTYNNPGIGMLGVIAAQSLNQKFDVLMEKTIVPALEMKNTYINIPESQMANYAQGYTEGDVPARVSRAPLADQAYGIKTTATDLLRFLEANMNLNKIDDKVQRAVTATHTGYFKVGGMTQDLIWEQYHYPVELNTLLMGNSHSMIFEANKASEITPPQPPLNDVWINKTGSTNGFSAYVVFIPERKMAMAMLANKSYPIQDRVTIAHQILQELKSK
jgi:beta-lactamase class C